MTVYQTIFRLVLTFGSESWVITNRQKNRIQAVKMKYHRRALGITKRDHKRNDDIREELGIEPVTTTIEKNQMVWTPNQNGRCKASQKNMGRKNKHQKRKGKPPRVLERNSLQSDGKTRIKLERSAKTSARQKKLVRICPQLNNLR
jgi:hypothetical protein